MLPVLADLLATLDRREGYAADVVVLLQPTSPMRRSEHIDQAVDLLLSTDADTVVSVVPVPHHFTPSSLMRLEGDRLVASLDDSLRRQDKPVLFARNGPAVLALKAQAIREGKPFYGGMTRGLPMAREDSLDIDDAADLKMAELLLGSRIP
jgi:CMP-N-acetylneuraminic acid synthetase